MGIIIVLIFTLFLMGFITVHLLIRGIWCKKLSDILKINVPSFYIIFYTSYIESYIYQNLLKKEKKIWSDIFILGPATSLIIMYFMAKVVTALSELYDPYSNTGGFFLYSTVIIVFLLSMILVLVTLIYRAIVRIKLSFYLSKNLTDKMFGILFSVFLTGFYPMYIHKHVKKKENE